MRRRNRMKIAVEMQIDLRRRLNRRSAAARRTPFHPKHRPQRRLPRRDNHLLPNPRESLRQPDRSDRLPLAARRRSRCRHQNQFPAPRKRAILQQIQSHLSAIRPNLLKILFRQFQFLEYFLNRAQGFSHVSSREPLHAARASIHLLLDLESREGHSLEAARFSQCQPDPRIPLRDTTRDAAKTVPSSERKTGRSKEVTCARKTLRVC